jgi:hypothetical protein
MKKEIDPRTKGIINNFALRYPVEPENASYKIVPGVVKDLVHDVQYNYAFELAAIPFKEELLIKNSTNYESIFKGAINWSVSPKGNQFEGNYIWYKKKGDTYKTQASDIKEVLQRYGFSFYRGYNNQNTKIPCVIYGNLISNKFSYIGQSKAEVDTTPFANAIIKAVKSIARDIPTFRVADIRTPEYHVGVSSSYISTRKVRSWKEPKPPKPERKTMFDLVYEQIKDRLPIAQDGREWTGEHHTQMSLWYNSLKLINEWIIADMLKKPKNRSNFIDCIRKVCEYYDIKREDIGIVAGAWATMFYMGKWSAVNFEDIEALAQNGTDLIFVEKQDIVQSLGPHASKYGVALINTRGHLSLYAHDLSIAAREAGAHIAIMTDYDIPGLHIASKTSKDTLWLGVDEHMLGRFGIRHEDKDWVIPYNPAKGLSDETIRDDIESDERFDYPRADVYWLKQKKREDSKFKDPGHKVEIDAVLAKAGSEGLWNYIMERLEEAYPERDYTRVTSVYNHVPSPRTIDFVTPSIVQDIQNYIVNRCRSLTEEERKEKRKELENYKGFALVQDLENGTRSDLNMIVKKDQQIKDIIEAFNSAAKVAKLPIIEAVESAIKKLDSEKGYDIMAAIKGE